MLSAFLKDCCVLKPQQRIRTLDLYQAYTRWCATECLTPAPAKDFRLAVAGRGFAYELDQRESDCWRGLSLKASV